MLSIGNLNTKHCDHFEPSLNNIYNGHRKGNKTQRLQKAFSIHSPKSLATNKLIVWLCHWRRRRRSCRLPMSRRRRDCVWPRRMPKWRPIVQTTNQFPGLVEIDRTTPRILTCLRVDGEKKGNSVRVLAEWLRWGKTGQQGENGITH